MALPWEESEGAKSVRGGVNREQRDNDRKRSGSARWISGVVQ